MNFDLSVSEIEGNSTGHFNFGVLDNRFLSRTIGWLDPPSPLIVGETCLLKEALQTLRQYKVGSLVIVDGGGKISGIFTERDVVLKLVLSDLNVEQTPVSALMTANPRTAQMTTTIAFALNMMCHGGYRHIPIVDDDGHPIGIISVKNIVDYVVGTMTKDLLEIDLESSSPLAS